MWKNVEMSELKGQSVIFKEKDRSNNNMYIIIKGKVGISVKPVKREDHEQDPSRFPQSNKSGEEMPS